MPPGRPRKNDDVLLKSAELIGWALGGLEREIVATKSRLASLTEQATKLRKRLGRRGAAVASQAIAGAEVVANRTMRRGRMSPEARKRISDMMKKRWAARKKAGKSRL